MNVNIDCLLKICVRVDGLEIFPQSCKFQGRDIFFFSASSGGAQLVLIDLV